jgi:hypothetical protein
MSFSIPANSCEPTVNQPRLQGEALPGGSGRGEEDENPPSIPANVWSPNCSRWESLARGGPFRYGLTRRAQQSVRLQRMGQTSVVDWPAAVSPAGNQSDMGRRGVTKPRLFGRSAAATPCDRC